MQCTHEGGGRLLYNYDQYKCHMSGGRIRKMTICHTSESLIRVGLGVTSPKKYNTVPDLEAGHIWKLDTPTFLGNYSMELQTDFCSVIPLLLCIFFNMSSGPFPCYVLCNFDISF